MEKEKKGEKKEESSEKKNQSDSEKVREIFEVEKKGEVEVKDIATEEKSEPSTEKSEKKSKEKEKKQIEHQNKILRNFLIGGVIIVLFTAGWFFGIEYFSGFKYAGLDFEVLEEGDITFYHTVFPVYAEGQHVANHNVFLRNDPRELESEIDFVGDLELTGLMVVEGLDEFNCDGDGVTSQVSFQQVMNAWGTEVIKDPEAECDLLGRYNYIQLVESEKTWIESFSSTCHLVHINNCEVFKAKERILVEQFKNLNS